MREITMGLSVLLLEVLGLILWTGPTLARLEGCLPGGGVDNKKVNLTQQGAEDFQSYLACNSNTTLVWAFEESVLAAMGRSSSGSYS